MTNQEIRDTIRQAMADYDKYHNDRRDRVIEARRRLADNTFTINNNDAVVTGAKEDFATVRTLDGSREISCAWTTVLTVLKNRNGAFTIN